MKDVLLIVQMFLARWTIDVKIISLELTVSGERGDGKRVDVERECASNPRTRSPSVTCLSARTLQIATTMDVTTDILALLPHPVSFQRAGAPRTVLATRTSPTMRDHEDVQTVFEFARNPEVEMSLCGDTVRFGWNPTQEFAEAKYMGVTIIFNQSKGKSS